MKDLSSRHLSDLSTTKQGVLISSLSIVNVGISTIF
jgi:hypothetical protein